MIARVYSRYEVARLANCHVSEIPQLIERGVLPKPLGKPTRNAKLRFSPVAVHKKLGIPLPPSLDDEVRAEIERAVRDAR